VILAVRAGRCLAWPSWRHRAVGHRSAVIDGKGKQPVRKFQGQRQVCSDDNRENRHPNSVPFTRFLSLGSFHSVPFTRFLSLGSFHSVPFTRFLSLGSFHSVPSIDRPTSRRPTIDWVHAGRESVQQKDAGGRRAVSTLYGPEPSGGSRVDWLKSVAA
jgi:hypothetical protein